MRRAPVGRGAFPPSARLDVMAMATRKPATYHCAATRWSLDDLVAALVQGRTWTMSRSSIWRLLDEADLQPHRSVYWLNSHDPDFEAKAHDLCSFYLNAHRFFEQSRGVQRLAYLRDPTPQHVFHFTPKHGSWLNQVELWLSVLARRFLKRGDDDSAQDFETRLSDYLEIYNTHHAHPYRWTYTGQPLVRATPFSRTRRQQRHGRAWFSARPKRFERVFYPPRPYNVSSLPMVEKGEQFPRVICILTLLCSHYKMGL